MLLSAISVQILHLIKKVLHSFVPLCLCAIVHYLVLHSSDILPVLLAVKSWQAYLYCTTYLQTVISRGTPA